MPITFPTGTKNVIDAIRAVIGRPVDFYTEISVPCSGCSIDPITDTSTNPFCGICGGNGYIYSYDITTISAHITWAGLDSLNWKSGGQIFQGDCGLQIEYTPNNKTVVDNSKYVVIDGKKAKVDKIVLRGVPTLNRILIDTVLDEASK
jgi:hypothetical protein